MKNTYNQVYVWCCKYVEKFKVKDVPLDNYEFLNIQTPFPCGTNTGVKWLYVGQSWQLGASWAWWHCGCERLWIKSKILMTRCHRGAWANRQKAFHYFHMPPGSGCIALCTQQSNTSDRDLGTPASVEEILHNLVPQVGSQWYATFWCQVCGVRTLQKWCQKWDAGICYIWCQGCHVKRMLQW